MASGEPAFTGLNEGLLEDSILPDGLNEVLEQLATPVGDSDEHANDEGLAEDSELDLSAGALDKASDPVRLYMREMGTVPLLKREQEVSIAKRIESGQKRAQRAITRSPIAVAELLKIGDELVAAKTGIRDIVTFSDETEPDEQEDRAAEHLERTIASIQSIGKLYRSGLKESEQLRAEHKLNRGRK